jgi:hypothetical protein
MIKITAKKGDTGSAYLFGLSEVNLNRLEFNQEPILFSFDYAGFPQTFGLVVYLPEMTESNWEGLDMEALERKCVQYMSTEAGITPDTLRIFVLSRPVMQRLRTEPFWGYETHINIGDPKDVQLFFAGRTEAEIEAYFIEHGFIAPRKDSSPKGFGHPRFTR